MPLRCGIVGLPNVGKTTLFNALLQTIQGEAANYPFCTIEPNVGIISVPDERAEKLAKLANSKELIKSQMEFVDIAGLVRGANKGEGLGNQFLANIREMDCIANVVRCFDDDNIVHVEKTVDPVRDIELIQTELILADLESIGRRIKNIEKKAKADKSLAGQLDLMIRTQEVLDRGEPAANVPLAEGEERDFKALQMLTGKKQFFVCNVDEHSLSAGNRSVEAAEKYLGERNCATTRISAKIESEIAALGSAEEKREFLETLGLGESGLDKIIRLAYSALDLITFFTVGPKETRCWTIKNGCLAPQAAGVIHTDFEKGFIRAETISYEDYVKYGTEDAVRNAGKLRLEGKDYVAQDGDIFHFRFNV
ncbi:MAG: redox-regulated ATPase YchF [Rickettsiales bacterium]|jgi:GTP-binding protein YchF|nr:redox-regulated ATPase YchF [Rickettsiales bacterium]